MKSNKYLFEPIDKELMFWLAKPETLRVIQYLSITEDYRKRVVDISIELNILQSTVTKMMIYFKKRGFVEGNKFENSVYLAPNRTKIHRLAQALEILVDIDDWDD